MNADPILEEVWRIKDKLSHKMAADPAAYLARLDEMTKAEEQAGRKVIRTPEELRHFAAEEERRQTHASAMMLSDKPARQD